mmetsp:Transcript_5519/g.13832  ORF Transcript_5519/g.13832 Transcript_5519/m.13832 type:complete len:207 (+) Transcript_5519:1770-2390(+)
MRLGRRASGDRGSGRPLWPRVSSRPRRRRASTTGRRRGRAPVGRTLIDGRSSPPTATTKMNYRTTNYRRRPSWEDVCGDKRDGRGSRRRPPRRGPPAERAGDWRRGRPGRRPDSVRIGDIPWGGRGRSRRLAASPPWRLSHDRRRCCSSSSLSTSPQRRSRRMVMAVKNGLGEFAPAGKGADPNLIRCSWLSMRGREGDLLSSDIL